MEVLCTKVKWQFLLVYFGDIVICLHSPDEHIDHVGQLLTLLNETSVTLNLKKLELFIIFIDYFSQLISPMSHRV